MGRRKASTKAGARRTVTCAFCWGKGTDPFELLSKLSTCQVCRGEGKVEVEEPAIECPYCDGIGALRTGPRIPCAVCGGKGKVTLPEKRKTCPQCDGTGASRESPLSCSRCKGKGFVPAD